MKTVAQAKINNKNKVVVAETDQTRIIVECDLNKKKWLSLEEAIVYMGAGSKATLQRWRDNFEIPYAKIGKIIVYRRKDIDDKLEAALMKPDDTSKA